MFFCEETGKEPLVFTFGINKSQEHVRLQQNNEPRIDLVSAGQHSNAFVSVSVNSAVHHQITSTNLRCFRVVSSVQMLFEFKIFLNQPPK